MSNMPHTSPVLTAGVELLPFEMEVKREAFSSECFLLRCPSINAGTGKVNTPIPVRTPGYSKFIQANFYVGSAGQRQFSRADRSCCLPSCPQQPSIPAQRLQDGRIPTGHLG